VVDSIGVPADFWFGTALAVAGLGAIASFGMKNEKLNLGTARMH
jgi:hypothetical protein